MPREEPPSPHSKIRILRRSLKVVLALGLFTFAVSNVPAQVTDFSNVTGNDEARRRTKQIRDARQSIDDYPAERWRSAAYLLVELTPREDGSTSVEIAERDRLKLPGVKKGDPVSTSVWIVPDGRRVFLRVNYLGVMQEVACSVPKKLRDRAVTLGVFPVYESQVECFVREVTP